MVVGTGNILSWEVATHNCLTVVRKPSKGYIWIIFHVSPIIWSIYWCSHTRSFSRHITSLNKMLHVIISKWSSDRYELDTWAWSCFKPSQAHFDMSRSSTHSSSFVHFSLGATKQYLLWASNTILQYPTPALKIYCTFPRLLYILQSLQYIRSIENY